MDTDTIVQDGQNAAQDAGVGGGLNLSPAPAVDPGAGLSGGTGETKDPRDARIAELERQLHAQSVESGRLRKANDELRQLREENERLRAAQPKDYMKDVPENLRDRIDADQVAALGAIIDKRFEGEETRRREADARAAAERQRETTRDMDRRIDARWPGFIRDTDVGGSLSAPWQRFLQRFGNHVSMAYSSGDFDSLALHIDAFLRENGIRTPANGAGTGLAPSTPRSTSMAPTPGDPAGDTRRYTFAEYSAAMRKLGSDYREGKLSDADYGKAIAALNRARDEGRVQME